VVLNSGETELGEPKEKDDAREKISVDFEIERVFVKPNSGAREDVTACDD
jgi:hypothetical protein